MRIGLSVLFIALGISLNAQVDKTYKDLTVALENPDSVFILELRQGGLTEFPSEIFRFKNLRSLNLSANNIDSIPSEIESLSALQEFYFIGNELKVLPNEFANLEELITLGLGMNKFDSFPRQILPLKNRLLFHWS